MEFRMDTMSRINEKFNKMSKGHKKIASFIIDHYEQAAFMTAAKLGSTVGISESTVVRFAYALGYEGYPEFQEDLADWVKNKLNSVQKIGTKYGKSTQSEILTSVLTADMDKISDTIEHVDPHAFETAVDTIPRTRPAVARHFSLPSQLPAFTFLSASAPNTIPAIAQSGAT